MLVNVEFGSRQLSNIVTALNVFAHKYKGLKSLGNILGSNWEIPEFTEEDIKSLFEAVNIFGDCYKRAEEEEAKPKYEHRYAVRDYDNEVCGEHDTLESAWEHYCDNYKEKYGDDGSVGRGDFNIYDNKTEKIVTYDVPYFTAEFTWDASINIRLEGDDCDNIEVPDEVWENIGECIAQGDDYGSYEIEEGDTCFDDICDWENECEPEPETVAEETPTEPVRENYEVIDEYKAEETAEPDNTWHVY